MHRPAILIWHWGRGKRKGNTEGNMSKEEHSFVNTVRFAALVVLFLMSDIVFYCFSPLLGAIKYSALTLDGMSRQKHS